MILGIGLHFLPRLASAPAVNPRLAQLGFWTLLAGLVLRVIPRPLVAVLDAGALQRPADIVWLAGTTAELSGLLIVLAALARAVVLGRAVRTSPAVRAGVPFFALGFGSLLIVSGTTLVVALRQPPVAELPLDRAVADSLMLLTFYGFLVPVSIAMSARLFPLYLRTHAPRQRLLQTGLTLLVAATAARLASAHGDMHLPDRAARFLVPIAVVAFVVGTGVCGPRRPLPRRAIRIWQDAPGLHALFAYLWLLAAALVQTLGSRWQDAEQHLLGMGFVTMLILGMGVHLLPGFARRSVRHTGYVWATLALGNLATVCRVVPAIPDLSLDHTYAQLVGALAGVTGLLAIALFAVNLSGALGRNDGQPTPQPTTSESAE